jgi:hypothetical protein
MTDTAAHQHLSHKADGQHPATWSAAAAATLHCLTRRAIGEALGMTRQRRGSRRVNMELMDNAFISRGQDHAVVHAYHH